MRFGAYVRRIIDRPQGIKSSFFPMAMDKRDMDKFQALTLKRLQDEMRSDVLVGNKLLKFSEASWDVLALEFYVSLEVQEELLMLNRGKPVLIFTEVCDYVGLIEADKRDKFLPFPIDKNYYLGAIAATELQSELSFIAWSTMADDFFSKVV